MAGQVKDREAFQRLNFLYQAAHCVLAQDPENQALARFYCHTERTIAKRLVLRRDPSVKRTLCRGCSSLLVPGLTCTQRQRPWAVENSCFFKRQPHPCTIIDVIWLCGGHESHHRSLIKLQGTALDSTDLPNMPAQPTFPQ
nr:ribonuclease P protein subunit p21 isoform X3 [Aotus nancymaae]